MKDVILEYALDKEGKAPMNVSAVDDRKNEKTEDVASVGAPKGVGAGKGAGAGGGKTSNGKGKWGPGTCRICGEGDHWGRDCPWWKPPKGGKKGKDPKGKAKGKGKGKKGKAKGGVNEVADENSAESRALQLYLKYTEQ